ncbi:cupin domain-containing protein [Geminicoccus flavidas]|uniref:cupin domain-containing protein n=1 Tax=Geminicoccus flavidas TaxID=2506407 RepID=UPI00135CBDF5|nr:cupin domain-containing protein [Geminicoccus flavidas]
MFPQELAASTVRLDDVSCWNVLGDEVRHLARGAGQAWSLFEIRTNGPMGPPPHRHAWEELFIVLEGRLELFDGEQWVSAGPGTVVRMPGNLLHTYRAGAAGTRFLALITPGGAETFFRELAEGVATMPPDPEVVMAVCARHGVQIVGAGGA